jgi:hypothetical protein
MGNVDSAHLEHGVSDLIVWKFSKDGCYSSATAYRMQFLGLTKSFMYFLVWKPRLPPNTIFYLVDSPKPSLNGG